MKIRLRYIVPVLLMVLVSSAQTPYNTTANWIYEQNTKKFVTDVPEEIERIKDLFSMSKVSIIRNAKKVVVTLDNPYIGINENDTLLFLDDRDRTLLAIIITVGWLEAAYELQTRILDSPVK